MTAQGEEPGMTESAYGPSWYAATMMAAPERDRLVYDLDADVCVIGGGLAGLTTARELARRGWSVVVLEASRVAWSASGRNAGIVAPGFAESIERIIERVGFERTRSLWILSAGGVDYVRSAIRETQMPGVSPVDGWLAVQRIDNQDRLSAQAELIGEKLGTEVEAWPTERVREVLKSPAYFQGLHLPGGFHIHPLNYALGLAAAAEESGAKIFENTRALEIDAAGVRKRVTTPAGRVRAGYVVLAGSAHLSPLLPAVSGSVLPVASYVATTASLGERLDDAITYTGAVVDNRRTGDYYRIVDGHRLMWGGRLSAHLDAPRRLKSLIRRDMLKAYPQVGEVEITHAWSGVMAYAVHKMPQIGEVSPGLWVATAFGSHGLNTSAMAGELIARAIAETDDRWRLFGSYDLVYAGGAIGRATAQVLFWFMRGRDALDEQIAWRRAATRRRNEALAARAAEEARQRVAADAQRRAAADAERLVAGEADAAERTAERAGRLATQEAAYEVSDRAAHIAAGEPAHRIADESARLAADAERLAAAERPAAANAARITPEAEEPLAEQRRARLKRKRRARQSSTEAEFAQPRQPND
jgi:gamma-glutamylputrescine oxidase